MRERFVLINPAPPVMRAGIGDWDWEIRRWGDAGMGDVLWLSTEC